MRAALIVLCAAGATAAPANAGMVEEAGSPIAVGTEPWWATAADLNGDGRPDLAVANDTSAAPSGTVSVLLRQPLGGFAAESPITVGGRPDAIAAADLDADGRRDLAVTNFASSTVSVLLRRTDNTGFVEEGAPLAVGTSPHAVAAGDVNGDGRPDLVTVSYAQNTVSVLLRKPDNTGFTQEAGSPVAVGANPTQLVLADFDGDGRLDIATADRGSDAVTVLLRKASNDGFAPEAGPAPTAGDAPVGIATADFNGDARPDLAVTAEASDDVTVLLRQAAGGFAVAPGSPVAAGDGAYGVTTGDFDADGVTDLATSASTGNRVTVLHGAGDGRFTQPAFSPLPTAKGPLVLAAADFDADGRSDLAIPDHDAHTVTVRLSRADPDAAPVPAVPAGCTPPTADRIALWRGEDNARDSVGAHDGSLEHGGGYRDGRVGRAFSLPGSDDYLHIPDRPDLNITGDLTLDAWVQLDDLDFGMTDPYGVGGDRVIAAKPDASDSAVTFAFWIEGDSPRTAQSAPLAFASGARSDASTVVTSDALSWERDTWYHVTVTRSGGVVRFFRDGEQVGSATIGGTPTATAAAPAAIGASPYDATIFNPLKGGIDEAQIFTRALDAGEVKAIQDTVTGACATPAAPAPPTSEPPAGTVPQPPASTVSEPVAQIARPTISGAHVVFDASASANVTGYRWDITGDRRPDVDCGDQPRLSTTLENLAADRTVLLVADGRTGTSDTATATAPRIRAAARRGARAAQLRTSQYADFVFCDGGTRREDLTENGGPPAGCNERVVFGLVEAQGCFTKVTTRATLSPAVIDALRREVQDNAELQSYLGGVIAGGTARASQTLSPKPIDLEAALDLGEFYTSDKPVRINGLDFYPRKGTDVVLSAALRYVIAENAGVRLETAPVRSGSLVLNVAESRGKVDVGEVNLGETSAGSGDPRAPLLGGFPVAPQARVTFVREDARRISRIAAHVRLVGSGLTLEGGGVPALDAVLVATNDEALAQRPLAGTLGPVRAGAWPIREGTIGFSPDAPAGRQCNLDAVGSGPLWTMGGDLLLSFAARLGLKLEPPPLNGICFQNGRFKSAGATLELPEPGVLVGPGILLESIGMNFQVDPSVLRGTARLSGAKVFTLDGRILAAFPSSDAKFAFSPGDLPLVPNGFGGEYIDPVFGVGGSLGITIPLFGQVRLLNAGFVYAYPAAVGFGAQLAQENGDPLDFLGIVQIKAEVQGALNFENGRFNVAGSAEVCVVDTVCGGAIGVFSNVGLGGCVKLGPVQVGGGIQWPDKVFLWPLDGCRWTRFNEENVRGRAAQVQQSYPVTVAEAGQSQAIELRGVDAAPIVRVVGPDGETAELPADANHVIGRRIRIMRSARHKVTVIGLQDPVAGTYRIERLPNSAAFGRIATALDPDAANVTATLDNDTLPRLSASAAQAGTRRATLRYAIRPRPGQTVTFLDGGRILAEVRGGGRGAVRVALPQDGRLHRIVARPALNGVPVPGEDRVVARVRTRRPVLRGPSRLRVTRQGAVLAIRWRGTAARHVVVVRERGGAARAVITRGRALRIRASRTQAGTVAVRALGETGRLGPAARVRFRAVARARTRFLPYSVLRGRPPKDR